MREILNITVTEDMRWSVSTDGPIDNIAMCASDTIVRLIETLAKDSNGVNSEYDFYKYINSRVQDKLFGK